VKIAIVSPGYPSKDNANFGFVHARAKLYNVDHEVKIFSLSKHDTNRTFESIQIVEGNSQYLTGSIIEWEPDVLAIHFPDFQIINLINKLNYPKVVWIHGHEVIFSFRLNGNSKNIIHGIKRRLLLIPRQIYQIWKIRTFIKAIHQVVFVSHWMRQIAEKNLLKKVHNGIVIPNPIDTNLFKYNEPIISNPLKIISIRGLQNKKYGVDIGIRAFQNFQKVNYEIYGQGKLFPKYNKLIENTKSSTTIHNVALEHSEIPNLLRSYCIFIAPSRVEAQGVSMCEAMATGMPVIATNIGGIPEFVRDGIDGFLVENEDYKAIKDRVNYFLNNPEKLIEMGKNARENILNTCSSELITAKEIEIFKEAINAYQ
jgi:glycosyltransferase involved in cell wall biosynthesis